MSLNLPRLMLLTLSLFASSTSLADITIHDSEGEKTFSKVPERVVVLNWDLIEQVLELDVTPLGGPNIEGYNTWVAQPHASEQVADIGTRAEPNLEKVAALKPDVIIAASPQKDLLDSFSEIAPVVLLENYQGDYDAGEQAIANFRTLAKLFKKEALAEAKLEQLHSDLASLKQQLEQSFGQELPSVLPARFGSETTVFLYTENSSSDWVLKQLGLKNALPLPPTLWGTKQMRIDQLKDLTDAYFLYILPFNEEAKLKKSFLWQAMPFVRAKHYNSVAPVWSFGGAMSLRYTAEAYTKSLLEIAQ